MIEPKKIELQKFNRSMLNLRILNKRLSIDAMSQKSSFRQGHENMSRLSIEAMSQKSSFRQRYENISRSPSQRGDFNASRTNSMIAKDSPLKNNKNALETVKNNSIINNNNTGIINVRKSVQQILFGLNKGSLQFIYKPKSTMNFNMNFYFESHHKDNKKRAFSSFKRNSIHEGSEHKDNDIGNFDEELEEHLIQVNQQLEKKRERKEQNDYFDNKQDPISPSIQPKHDTSEISSLKKSQVSFMRISSKKKSFENNKKASLTRSLTVFVPSIKHSPAHNSDGHKIIFKKSTTLFSGILKKIFGKSADILDNFKKEENLIDFNLEDFKYFEKMKENQGKKIEMELRMLKERSLFLNLGENLKRKWQNARRMLMLGVKMNRFNDDIKIYGSSINAGIELGSDKELYNCIIQQDQMKMIKKTKKKTQQEHTHSKLLLLPNDRIVKFWSYILALMMIYTATIMPFRIAFMKNDDSDTFSALDYFSDALFMMDICINLNLAYYDDSNHLITSRKKIFLHYLLGWLIIDIIGVFPFETITSQKFSEDSTNNAGGYNDFIKLLRLPRLYRLVKISRLFKFIKSSAIGNLMTNLQLFLKINSSYIQVMKFIMTVILIVHILGCLWYFEAQLQDFAPDTWVSELFLFIKYNNWVIELSLSKFDFFLSII